MATVRRSAVNSSALHVFEVLRLIADTKEPLGVSAISRRLGLPASTVYRALTTLEESDYLVRFQNMPRYELGPMPRLLNRALVHRFKLHAAGRPLLRALAESTGQTVSLTVRLGWYGLRLAGVYGSRDIYHRDRLGEVMPMHRNLPGLGMLAFLPASEIDPYCAFVDRHHPRLSKSDWGELEEELSAGRERGFCYERLADNDGLAAVALPVREPAGQVMASLAISGPIYSPESGEAQDQWFSARDALEREIAAAPAEFKSPFSRIPSDEIVIRGEARLGTG